MTWTEQKNVRRGELIDKDIACTITIGEMFELARLNAEVDAHVEKVAPRPTARLEKLEQLVKETA